MSVRNFFLVCFMALFSCSMAQLYPKYSIEEGSPGQSGYRLPFSYLTLDSIPDVYVGGSESISHLKVDPISKELEFIHCYNFKFLGGVLNIEISPDGKFVYLNSNNDDNDLLIFERNSLTGELTLVEEGVISSRVSNSRITISANGKFAYYSDYFDKDIRLYQRNASNGKLSFDTIYKNVANGVYQHFVIGNDGLNGYLVSDNLVHFKIEPTSGRLTKVKDYTFEYTPLYPSDTKSAFVLSTNQLVVPIKSGVLNLKIDDVDGSLSLIEHLDSTLVPKGAEFIENFAETPDGNTVFGLDCTYNDIVKFSREPDGRLVFQNRFNFLNDSNVYTDSRSKYALTFKDSLLFAKPYFVFKGYVMQLNSDNNLELVDSLYRGKGAPNENYAWFERDENLTIIRPDSLAIVISSNGITQFAKKGLQRRYEYVKRITMPKNNGVSFYPSSPVLKKIKDNVYAFCGTQYLNPVRENWVVIIDFTDFDNPKFSDFVVLPEERIIDILSEKSGGNRFGVVDEFGTIHYIEFESTSNTATLLKSETLDLKRFNSLYMLVPSVKSDAYYGLTGSDDVTIRIDFENLVSESEDLILESGIHYVNEESVVQLIDGEEWIYSFDEQRREMLSIVSNGQEWILVNKTKLTDYYPNMFCDDYSISPDGDLMYITSSRTNSVHTFAIKPYGKLEYLSELVNSFNENIGLDYVSQIQFDSVSNEVVCIAQNALTVLGKELALPSEFVLCKNSSVTLNAGQGFLSYLWSPSNETTSSIKIATPGVYSVKVENADHTFDSATVTVLAANSNYDFTLDSVSFCHNDSLNLELSPEPYFVRWSDNSYSDDFWFKENGRDSVFIVDEMGCGEYYEIEVESFPVTEIPDTLMFCEAERKEIDLSDLGETYWDGSFFDREMYYVNDTGYVQLRLIDTNNCTAKDSIFVGEYDAIVLPVFSDTILLAGDTLVINGGEFSNYYWNNGDTTANRIITISDFGSRDYINVSLQVKDSNGCIGNSYMTVFLSATGVGDIRAENRVKIFPNPVNQGRDIFFESTSKDKILVRVYNATGQVLKEFHFHSRFIIDTEAFTPGVYYFEIGGVFQKLLVSQ